MDLQLKGRVAIVTGSGRGIGRAAVTALAKEGVRVVVTDIDAAVVESTSAELRAQGHEVLGVRADVCDEAQVQQLVDRSVAAFGKVDILVNNAGFTRDKYLLKMPMADWDAVIDTVLKGAYLCTRAALPSMMAQKWGRVVNISSRAHWGNPGQTNYSAAKAGLIGFTRALALEQGKFNITANAIAPGFIETELVKALPTYERLRDAALQRNSVPRIGTPDDVAGAILYLASEYGGYITGETIHVSGGRFSG
ncbi:3-oxoacyl-ACP reductase FabG [Pseudorhodoferax sp.]|uniref:3-oxoacyl-ACP reductase FabG n=1 Tax=Pseudorhodoferax sp. TaxID=1993553 RepID=UPI002DD68E25|nr:3-oxoacyl-ACP reductase FabG [Pseudorhodoferax sp.]